MFVPAWEGQHWHAENEKNCGEARGEEQNTEDVPRWSGILGETRPMERYIVIIIYHQLSALFMHIIVFHTCNRLLRISTGKAYMRTWYNSASTSCDKCQRTNHQLQKPRPELHASHPCDKGLVQSWHWLNIGPLPETSSGNKYIITLSDYFFQVAWGCPTPIEISRRYSKLTFCRHGWPKVIQSDQGREFVNEVNARLFQLTDIIQHCVSSAYHAPSNEWPWWTFQPDCCKHSQEGHRFWCWWLGSASFCCSLCLSRIETGKILIVCLFLGVIKVYTIFPNV